MPEHVAEAVEVTTAGGLDAELAADALWQAGAAAVEERSVRGGTLLVAATADGSEVRALAAAVAGRWPAEVVAVDAGAALDAWRAHARAVTVGRVTVRPPWVPPLDPTPDRPPDRASDPPSDPAFPTTPPVAGRHGDVPGRAPVEIVVDPGRAFGSGSHASTRLALTAVADLVRGGESVLDVGCGSGVLAIATLALGARHAVGVDVDPAARSATLANAERNGVAGRLTVHASLADVVRGGDIPPAAAAAGRAGGLRPARTTFDLVVANLLAPVLVELAPALRQALAPGGTLVLSGLLAAQRTTVLAAHPDLAPAGARTEGGWVALTLRRAAAA